MNFKKYVRPEIFRIKSKEYAPKQKDLYKKCDLSLNVNPYGVSPKVVDVLKKINSRKISHYYPENQILIKKISEYMDVEPDQILLGDGCDGCLEMIAHTFINKNNEVIIPTPTFHRYEFFTTLMGGKPVFVPMQNFEINPEDIFKKVNKKTKLIFLCNPNNPTGISIKREIKEYIIKNFEGIVVIDEALADAAGVNGSTLLKKYNNIVIVRSFSKTFGLASLRIGYIIAHKELIEEIKKTSSPFKVNGIAQELAIVALEDKEHIKKSIRYMNKTRDYLISNLENIGFKCTKSVTTNFLVDISPVSNDSTKFVEKLKQKNILVTGTNAFRLNENTYIRVSLGSEEENKKFIQIMKEIKSHIKN